MAGLLAERKALLDRRTKLRRGRHWSVLPPEDAKQDEEINAQLREINKVLFGDSNEDALKVQENLEKANAPIEPEPEPEPDKSKETCPYCKAKFSPSGIKMHVRACKKKSEGGDPLS